MLRNYIRVTLRNLSKRKGHAFINITGLAIGIACCLLIFIYIFKELSYDRFHEKSDRIYRVVQTYQSESRVDAGASTPFRVGPRLQSEYSHLIENSVRFFNLQAEKLTLANREQDKLFKEPNFFFVDSTAFDLFSINLVRGNPDEALANPQSLVISEEMVEKYFGDEDPIGKQLNFEGRINLTVTGILKKLPSTSHIDIDFLASFSTLDPFYNNRPYDTSWYWNPCWTYILLEENVEAETLENQFPSFVDKYYHPNIPESERVEMDLQPLNDIHLHSQLDQEIQANGDIQYVYIFSAIAILILIVGCMNFVNLVTARSASRSKEVGMRKALGADRWDLFKQFMGESFLMSFFAIILSLFFVYLMLPVFNSLLEANLSLNLFDNGLVIAGLFVLFIVVGLLSGVYPALVLSNFKPIKTLRGEFTKSKKGRIFRRVLVVLQFSFSIFLIIGTVIIFQQVNFLQEKDLGFDKEEVVIIPTDLTLTIWYYDDFKQKLEENPNIQGVTGVKNVLGSLKNIYSKYTPEGYSDSQSLPNIMVMHDFIETYDINMLAGRSFSEEYGTDRTQAVLINKAMVDHLQWGSPEDALGRTFTYQEEEHQVIGVTENFNHTSLRRQIEPLVINMPPDQNGVVSNIEYIAVKINSQNVSETIDYMRKTWDDIDQTHPFDYFFHDDRLDTIYKREAAMGRVSASFTILCIIVACLGLFGLASYSAENRTKEIGIRKALGASVTGIVTLMTREFMTLVLIANVIAWPAAYYLGSRWLEDFAYRIGLGIDILLVFLAAGLAALVISLLTISYHSIKAATVNPAQTIREE